MAGLKGLDKVVSNLNKEIVNIRGRTMRGLIKSAIIVRRSMDEVSPLIPVDTGNLRSSWFPDPFYIEKDPALEIGFTATYAVVVHEMVGANFKRPGAGAKFFEASLKRNMGVILKTIAEEAGIR